MSQFQVHVENGFCNSDQKSMLMVGFLTCNDSDILRSKTGPYRRVGYQTNIPPTTTSFLSFLVFVCPPPHLHHLLTPSALVHLPSATSTPTLRCTRATMLHPRLD